MARPPQARRARKATIYAEASDTGWSFTVPADTTTRTLYIYLGGWGFRQAN